MPLADRFPPPQGSQRIAPAEGSFGDWLEKIPIDTNKKILHYYTGDEALQQNGHAAIVDIPVKNNVQDSRKIIMRIRAEYLYQQGRYDEIEFRNKEGRIINPRIWYAQKYPGTEFNFPYREFNRFIKESLPGADWSEYMNNLERIAPSEAEAGDIVYQKSGGSHAMMIAGAAENPSRERMLLFIEGATPPAEVHVVANPADPSISPWYRMEESRPVRTPYWVFNDRNFYRFVESEK